jgi:hypothetical protein
MTPPNRRLLASFLAVVIAACIWLITSAVSNRAPDWSVGEDGDHCGSRGSCNFQLGQLYKAMYVYLAGFGNNRDLPPHRGETFWKCLAGKYGIPRSIPSPTSSAPRFPGTVIC